VFRELSALIAMPLDNRPKSLKELRDRTSQLSFIGREAQLQQFRSVLATPYEKRDCFLFSVSGQGGIGKTTLLKQFRKITTDLGHVATYVDEGSPTNPVDNVLEALSRLAADLEKQEYECKKFQERYKTYRQRKQELQSDPDAPKGLAAHIGKVIAKVSIGAAKSNPLSGAVMGVVDENALVDQAGEVATFVAQKLSKNKDDVQLVNEPLEVLTPLFLEDLNTIAEHKTVVLLLDTFEQTGTFLGDWLLAVLDERYSGVLHPNCLICVAGRDPLPKNNWAEWEDMIGRSELEPFTEAEARQYLASKGNFSESVLQEIWRLSSDGVPLLIEMMAQNAPMDAAQVSDPCEDAVERFLKWEKDDTKRQVLLDASVPRVLNRDVLAVLTNGTDADGLFDWLKSRSFVVEHPDGWQYHGIVRQQMVRYQRRVSLQSWAELQPNRSNLWSISESLPN
jgi:hypothetical protein